MMAVMKVVGWPKVMSPGNTTHAREVQGRARDFCFRCFCLSKVLCALVQMEVALASPPVQLDPEHTTHVPAQRYQEICQRFGFAQSYISRLYSERHELRLRTRLEVEGIPLDSSDEDEDGSSSDDAPPSPPPPAVAGPSRRRR
ncbi:hypothetical protein JCGZ_06376 [Jatropha curcas]|uniref:Uncharacterized protein n=1 Tax=Jatropha curcas TaxID=180498 RepID=A0A067KSE5_JATCU|nr:hypothetical protein JCGZ_06376 [Jatropha curcas]